MIIVLKGTQRTDYGFIYLYSFQIYRVFQELQERVTGMRKEAALDLSERVREMTIDWQTCQTSSCSCSKMGVFAIGEKPKTGIPNCLMNRASVVEANISGFASFPPTAVIACWKTDHHGLELLVGVSKGRPLQSLMGPFSLICHINKVISDLFAKKKKKRKFKILNLVDNRMLLDRKIETQIQCLAS